MKHPTHCEHDELLVYGYNPDDFTPEDLTRLDQLGFFVSEPYGEKIFMSFKYGSC